jgi:hypothetical protein
VQINFKVYSSKVPQIMTDIAIEDIPPDVRQSLLDCLKKNKHFDALKVRTKAYEFLF